MRNPRPLYREVLRDALRVAWRNKHLWPLGFLAGILLSGSPYDLISRCFSMAFSAPNGAYGSSDLMMTLVLARRVALQGIHAGLPWIVLPIGLIVIALVAAVVWLATVAQGGLLAAVAAGGERRQPGIQAFFNEGLRRFWPLLVVNLLLRAVVALAVLAIAAVFIPAVKYANPLLIFTALAGLVLIVPFAYLATNVAFFAAMGIVRRKERLLPSLAEAWTLTLRHWLVVLETSFVVFALDLVAALGLALAAAVLSVPFLILFLAAAVTQSAAVLWTVLGLYFLLLLALILTVASAAVTFHYAVWALLAERLRKGEATAKLLRAYRAVAQTIRR
jgi:hypothetical protein